jgi:hypothetical protein
MKYYMHQPLCSKIKEFSFFKPEEKHGFSLKHFKYFALNFSFVEPEDELLEICNKSVLVSKITV